MLRRSELSFCDTGDGQGSNNDSNNLQRRFKFRKPITYYNYAEDSSSL